MSQLRAQTQDAFSSVTTVFDNYPMNRRNIDGLYSNPQQQHEQVPQPAQDHDLSEDEDEIEEEDEDDIIE